MLYNHNIFICILSYMWEYNTMQSKTLVHWNILKKTLFMFDCMFYIILIQWNCLCIKRIFFILPSIVKSLSYLSFYSDSPFSSLTRQNIIVFRRHKLCMCDIEIKCVSMERQTTDNFTPISYKFHYLLMIKYSYLNRKQ